MGTWINPNGFTLRLTGKLIPGFPPWRRRVEYEFRLSRTRPLTYFSDDGRYIQPDRHGCTDMGSVPEFVQGVVPKDSALRSFILHDSGCRERGLYFAATLAGPYTFLSMPSPEVHAMLRQGVTAERGPWLARSVWCAVRTFGPRF